MSYLNFAMKEKDGAGKRKREPMERIALFPTVPCCFERPTYAITFARGNRKKA